MTSHSADALPRITAYLEERGLAAHAPRILPLTPDASDRRYFRVLLDGGRSMVLAVYTGPIAFATMPYANVAELLRHLEIPAPAILHHSDPLGIVEQEDLGDVTLQAHLGADSVTAHAARALGLGGTHGTLQAGKQADFVVWDLQHANELAYWFGRNPCRRVVRAGVERAR